MLAVVLLEVFLYTYGLLALSDAYAACKPDGPPVTSAMVSNFLDMPDLVLGNDAITNRAAYALSVSISQYAAADQRSVQALKLLMPKATFQQRVAIGRGLYAAMSFCRPIDPAISTRIDGDVRLIWNRDVILAYQIAEELSDSSSIKSKPKTLAGLALAKPSGSVPSLLGEPTPTSSGRIDLKLGDPFGSPDAWR
jgi:hypothetical protein